MLTPFFSILLNYSSKMLKKPSGPSADGSFRGVPRPRDDDPSPACGPKPFGGRRPEGFGPQGEESRPDQIGVSSARFLSRDYGMGMTTRFFSILPERNRRSQVKHPINNRFCADIVSHRRLATLFA
jgi:hypothetical protein